MKKRNDDNVDNGVDNKELRERIILTKIRRKEMEALLLEAITETLETLETLEELHEENKDES